MIHTEHDLWSKYVQYSTGGVMACNGSTVQGWDVIFDNYILLSDSAHRVDIDWDTEGDSEPD